MLGNEQQYNFVMSRAHWNFSIIPLQIFNRAADLEPVGSGLFGSKNAVMLMTFFSIV